MSATTGRRIRAYEIENHGQDHAQYFQGAGLAFTDFEDMGTGAGDNALEAYNDAVECLAQMGWDVSRLPKRPRGIRKTDEVIHQADPEGDAYHLTPEDDELWWYVTVRVR